MLSKASRHHDFVDLSALVKKAGRYAADFVKPLTSIKSDRRRVFRAYRQLDLTNARRAGTIEQKIEHRDGAFAAALGVAHIDHDDGGAVRHLAGLLPHQPHDADRLIAAEADDNRVVGEAPPPLLVRQAFPVREGTGKCLGTNAQGLQANSLEDLEVVRIEQFQGQARGSQGSAAKPSAKPLRSTGMPMPSSGVWKTMKVAEVPLFNVSSSGFSRITSA